MALRHRPFPADVRQDIKLLKVVPIESLIWGIVVLVVGLFMTILFAGNILIGFFLSLIPSGAVFIVAALQLHTKVIKNTDLKIKKATVKKLDDLSSIKENGTISKTKNNEYRAFLQKKVDPWEVCPDSDKDRRANDFTDEIFSAVSNGVGVSIFATSSPENTAQLEERLKTADELPEKIANIEKARIERHYRISLSASSTQYIIRLSSRDIERIEDYADRFSNTIMLGEDIINDITENHLTPGTRRKRGRDEIKEKNKLTIENDKLILNNMYVKTYMITEFPLYPIETFAGILYFITHGEHAQPGVIINYAIHFKPSTFKFDSKMKFKIRRLQRNIRVYENSGDIADPARKEEKDALEWLIRLRDSGISNFADVWLTVTISCDDPVKFKANTELFKDLIENKGFTVSTLESEQHTALDSAWMAGGITLFERYYGRVMDKTGVSALYPYLDGSVSDRKGPYIAHRVRDATIVNKDFTKDPIGQNVMVSGFMGAGKSTLIKGLITSELREKMRGYVYDVDGEYRKWCQSIGGVWVDYTTGNGLYVDPTIIGRPLKKEVDIYNIDSGTLADIEEVDALRYNEAVDDVFNNFILLSDTYDKDMENELDEILTQMWNEAGIYRDIPETWEIQDINKVALHQLFDRIKTRAKKSSRHEGANKLYKETRIYFEGSKSYLFKNVDNGDWVRDSNLIVYYIGSAADNIGDKKMNSVKIVSANKTSWNQIKLDRIKKQVYSFEVKDELNRSIRNLTELPYLIRGATTSRKFNSQLITGFNDPSILFKFDGGEAIWNNSRYKMFFPITEMSIRDLASKSSMPEEVIQEWLNLKEYEFIYSEMVGSKSIYDVLKMELPESELKLYKTRGLD